MKLRWSPTSPYVRKVMVSAHETGLDSQIELVPTNPWEAGTPLTDSNPLGKVPALETDDAGSLFDSPVICEYLDGQQAGDKLFPPAGPTRWRALRQQALGDGILDAAVLRLLESRRPEERRSADWSDRQKAAIGRVLDQLEAEISDLDGPVTIGHIAVGAALGYLDFRFADDDWRRDHPKLAAWYEGFSARPSMRATEPKDPPA